MIRKLVLLLGGAMVAGFTAVDNDAIQTPAYKECINLTNDSPTRALTQAQEWIKTDPGSIAAHHCRAMALYGLKRYGEAAESLSRVRTLIPNANTTLRSFVTRQTAAAWVKAGQPETAGTVLDNGINELDQAHGNNALAARLTSDLLLDRAKLDIAADKLSLATKDLDHAISLNPMNADALIMRAHTFELLHDYPLALADAEAAATISPNNENARKLMSRLRGKSSVVAE